MNNNNKQNNKSKSSNYWNLVFGILFLGYGTYKTITKLQIQTDNQDNFGIIIALGFIAVGVFEIYKFFKTLKNKKR